LVKPALVDDDPIAGALTSAAGAWRTTRDERALRRELLKLLAALEGAS
jgi:hypothetical protein